MRCVGDSFHMKFEILLDKPKDYFRFSDLLEEQTKIQAERDLKWSEEDEERKIRHEREDTKRFKEIKMDENSRRKLAEQQRFCFFVSCSRSVLDEFI